MVQAVGIILLAAQAAGEALRGFFGITINSFGVGGVILILLMSVSMMHSRISHVIRTPQESEESRDRDSIAIVPLVIPWWRDPEPSAL